MTGIKRQGILDPDVVKTVEEASGYVGFEGLRFQKFHEREGNIVFYPEDTSSSNPVTWLLAVPNSEYERWGMPERITGAEIIAYRDQLPR